MGPLLDRIRKKFFVTSCGHWLWTGALSTNGYGQVRLNGVLQQAHRVVYERLVGPIPKKRELDHLCRFKPCVNPACVEPVTHKVNMARGKTAQRTQCNYGHAYTKTNTIRRRNQHNQKLTIRRCRECLRLRSIAYRQRIKQQRNEKGTAS